MNFPIPFTKMSGTGNDFIVIDHRQPVIPENEQASFARQVCRRMFAAGADGLILIEASATADFSWRFYNADGSLAEMCGNGARCAARFAFERGIAGRTMRFATLAGIIKAEIIDGLGPDRHEVSLLMTAPFDMRRDLTVTLDGQNKTVQFMNSGVPHAILFIDKGEDFPLKKWGRAIRMHKMFQPAGTNANFVQVLGDNTIRVRTYERGVEDETMACGTGAVASAIFATMAGHTVSPVRVITSGGDQLTIRFDLTIDSNTTRADQVFLEGPARIIYEGQLTAEALR